jgi:predicted alpha/beta-hydrolase family hydrolase
VKDGTQVAKRSQEIGTEYGAARATLHGDGPRLLVLGHGAGGGVDAPDLVAVCLAVAGPEWTVALAEQPYRVAGRRSPPPAASLDAAWLTIVGTLGGAQHAVLVTGGRSSGARVACRTAGATGSAAVVALAFPLRPPGRPADRTSELTGAGVPTLVVQGTRDAFGGPELLPDGPAVHALRGADHSFRARRADGRSSADCAAEVGSVVRDWLRATLG